MILHSWKPRGLIGAAALVCALTPIMAHAQESPTVNSDQVRAEYVSAGYQVGPSTTWWTDGSTTFLVHPTSGSPEQMGRVLLVVVYPDLQTAESERQRIQTNAAQVVDPSKPLLVPGHAPTYWWQNVALVEEGIPELNQQYQSEVERDMQPDDTLAGGAVLQSQPQQLASVDADFVAVLLQGPPTVNL